MNCYLTIPVLNCNISVGSNLVFDTDSVFLLSLFDNISSMIVELVSLSSISENGHKLYVTTCHI